MTVDSDVRGQQGMALITGGCIIIDYGLIFSQQYLKHLNDGFFSHKNTAYC